LPGDNQMGLIFIILIVAITFIILLFVFTLRIKLVIDSDKPEINMSLFWLNPFINAFVNIENTVPMLKVYLFKQLIMKKALKIRKKKYGGMELIKLSDPKDVHVNVQYGFRDPFTTGVTCGVINMASQFINIDSINQTPEFMSDDDYVHLDATAKVNLGSTLIKLIKTKMQ
jgi:predicted membrane protein